MKSIPILNHVLGPFEIIKHEHWNSDYEAMIIQLKDSTRIRTRIAKSTPKKEGYFTVFLEKNDVNKNIPFSDTNSPELLAIIVCDSNRKGLFLFPKEIAIEKKIVSTNNAKGRMAMRVYPTWCLHLNKTATATQKWQINYFKDLSE